MITLITPGVGAGDLFTARFEIQVLIANGTTKTYEAAEQSRDAGRAVAHALQTVAKQILEESYRGR